MSFVKSEIQRRIDELVVCVFIASITYPKTISLRVYWSRLIKKFSVRKLQLDQQYD